MSDQNHVEVEISVKSSGAPENAQLTKILQEQKVVIESLTKSLGGLAAAQTKLSEQAANDAQERAQLRVARAAAQTSAELRKQQSALDDNTARWIRDLDEIEAREEKLEKKRETWDRQAEARTDKERKRRQQESEQQARESEAQLSRQARLALLPAIGVSGASLGSVGQAGLGFAGSLGIGGGAASGAGVLGGLLSKIGPTGIAAAGAAIGIGVLAKELSGLVIAEAANSRELQNFALRLNLTVAEAQRLDIAAKLTGISITGLEQSSRVLAAILEDPTGQGKRGAQALRDLGISLQDSSGNAKEENVVLLELLKTLSTIPSATERIRVASETLGRGAKVLTPLLVNYQALKVAVDSLDPSVDANNNTLLKTDENIRKLTVAWDLLKKSLAADLAPAIDLVSQSLLGWIENIDKVKSALGLTYKVLFHPGEAIGGAALSVADQVEQKYYGLGLTGSRKPEWQIDVLNASKDAAVSESGKAGAKKFKATEYATDVDYVQGLLNSTKSDNAKIRNKLESSDLSESSRSKFEQDLRDGLAEENKIKAHLNAMHKVVGEENQIIKALRHLEEQTEEIEAWDKDPGDRVNIRRKAFIDNFTDSSRVAKLTPGQLQTVSGAFDRQEVQRKKQAEDARQRAARADQFRVEQEQLKKQQEYDDHIAKAGFGGRDTTTDQIVANADRAKAARQSLGKLEEDQIRRDEKKPGLQADQLAAAASRLKLDLFGIELEKKREIFDLNERIKKQDEEGLRSIRGAVRADNRSDISKDFEHSAKLTQLRAGFGEKPLAEVEARRQQYELAAKIYQLDLEDAAHETDKNKQALLYVKALIDLKDKDRQAEREHETAVAEYDKKREEKVREVGGKLADALISKNPGQGLANFGLGEARSIGHTLGGNIAGELFKGRSLGLSTTIGGQTEDDGKGGTKLTARGRLLAGTPFGVDTEKIALQEQLTVTKHAADTTEKLDLTMQKLIGIFTGDTSIDASSLSGISAALPLVGSALTQGGASNPLAQGLAIAQTLGSVASGTGAGASISAGIGGFSKLLSIFSPSSSSSGSGSSSGGGSEDDEGRSLQLVGKKSGGSFTTAGGRSSIAGGLFNPDASPGDRAVSGVTTAAAAYGAERGIAAGIRQGGAKGTAGAISSAAGFAAAVDPEPISKAILGAVALTAGIVGDILGDPKKLKDEAITRRLEENKYQAPQTLTREEAIGGNSVVRDKYGRVSDSGFADLFSGTPSSQQRFAGQYYDLPGSIQDVYQSGYNGLSKPQGMTINMNINALDSQSILDRSADIGAALNKELISGSAVGQTIQQKVLGA